MSAFAALASGATLITFLCEWHAANLKWWMALILSLIFIAICTGYAICLTWRKSEITLYFNPKFKLTVKDGDFFKETGLL